jgi:hypothetical protein
MSASDDEQEEPKVKSSTPPAKRRRGRGRASSGRGRASSKKTSSTRPTIKKKGKTKLKQREEVVAAVDDDEDEDVGKLSEEIFEDSENKECNDDTNSTEKTRAPRKPAFTLVENVDISGQIPKRAVASISGGGVQETVDTYILWEDPKKIDNYSDEMASIFATIVTKKVVVVRCKERAEDIIKHIPDGMIRSNVFIMRAPSSMPRIVVIDETSKDGVRTYNCNLMRNVSLSPYISTKPMSESYYTYVYIQKDVHGNRPQCMVVSASNFYMANDMLTEFLTEHASIGSSKSDYKEAVEITRRDARVNYTFYP